MVKKLPIYILQYCCMCASISYLGPFSSPDLLQCVVCWSSKPIVPHYFGWQGIREGVSQGIGKVLGKALGRVLGKA